MALAARWVRLGPVEARALSATCRTLASVQSPKSLPIVLWAPAHADPEDAASRRYALALIAPVRCAPGRSNRWLAWGLAPAVSAFRHFGLRACVEGGKLWACGRQIAEASADGIGCCVVVVARLGFELPGTGEQPPSAAFRAWLREGVGLALSEWSACGTVPAEREIEAVFRARIEAQYGWEFETAWLSATERGTIEPAEAVMP